MSNPRDKGIDWETISGRWYGSSDVLQSIKNDPLFNLPPNAPSDLLDLLDYFGEKGLNVKEWNAHSGICSVVLENLKPFFFEKVVVPELKRRAVKWNRRITYRYKTKEKSSGSVSVHLSFYIKDERPEVVRFPS